MQYGLYTKFQQVFQSTQVPRCFFAPGRINLIGEHTDYNGGYVFPAAISLGTYALATKRNDRRIRMYSINFPQQGLIEFNVDHLSFDDAHDWGKFPKGMMHYLKRATNNIHNGMDILFYGNIPNEAGLSSSASIEIVTGVLLHHLFSLEIDNIDLIKIGQRVENEYLGINSGIMDQFAVVMGKAHKAIHLNTVTLEYAYANLQLNNYSIVIINSNKARTLASSAYNDRRVQCEQALKILQRKLKINHLCDVTSEMFEQYSTIIEDVVIRRRAKHVIHENERTKQALIELNSNNLKSFGMLLNESHISLRDDFEVTGNELDTIVETARKQQGVIGARATGAGFGGCAIAIVENDHIKLFKKNVAYLYRKKIGYDPTFFVPSIVDGAKEIEVTEVNDK